ncbi:MAG: hypothetical protein MHMPM18_002906 [Marteilia pararefringens]
MSAINLIEKAIYYPVTSNNSILYGEKQFLDIFQMLAKVDDLEFKEPQNSLRNRIIKKGLEANAQIGVHIGNSETDKLIDIFLIAENWCQRVFHSITTHIMHIDASILVAEIPDIYNDLVRSDVFVFESSMHCLPEDIDIEDEIFLFWKVDRQTPKWIKEIRITLVGSSHGFNEDFGVIFSDKMKPNYGLIDDSKKIEIKETNSKTYKNSEILRKSHEFIFLNPIDGLAKRLKELRTGSKCLPCMNVRSFTFRYSVQFKSSSLEHMVIYHTFRSTICNDKKTQIFKVDNSMF